jgi:GT2 family glycosyltransferase/Tfp pilus assembly protein PilF
LHGQPAVGSRTTVSAPCPPKAATALPSPREAGSPKVSIIIPTFNRLDLTQPCLRAIEANTPREQCEILVVDNASTDGTGTFLAGEQQAGRLTVIPNEKNLGFAHACNQGAAAARGKYVLFLNNDTEVTPGWLEPLIRTADADSRIGAVGSKLLFSDGTIQHAGVVVLDDRLHHDPLLAQHIFSHEPRDFPEASRAKTYQALTAACLLAPRDVFAAAGGFDEGFYNGYEDVDFCFRIAALDKILVYQPASVVIHHESQSGPERFRRAGQNIARLHQKWLGKIQADFIVGVKGETSPGPAKRIADYLPLESVAEDKFPAVSIIILALNQLEHTRTCLESIAAHTLVAHEVLVVDNGSTDATPEFLKTWQARHSNCTVIRNESNRGFAAGNNQGLAIARGKHLLLLNNDTVVTAGWLDAMLAVFQRHPGTGVVGPVSNCVSGPQQVREAVYQNLPEMHAFAGRYTQANAGQSIEAVRAVGFCLLVAQEVVNQIGGLDERFGSGNFEDDDFCIRAQLAGFRIRVARDSFVHHVGSQTFKGAKIDYRQAMLRNWDLFRAKWEFPAETTLERGYPMPKQLPKNLALKIALPALGATHSQLNGCWTEIKKVPRAAAPVKPAPVAQVGRLNEARELLAEKQFEASWQAVNTAIGQRPFHPEAFLLLAEIALAAGDGATARKCAQHSRDLAPGWDTAKQFLKRPLRAGTTPKWLALPAQIQKSPAAARLSVCLIVKNEEQFIGQCLKSVRDIASQIVVVDTGSQDRTVEIAREFGAEVSAITWSDDFAAARNAALERATGDWILMLDADEELPETEHKKLIADMKNATALGYRLPLVNFGQEAEGCSYVPRLFRNAPGTFYAGRIHEQVFPSIIPLCHAWGIRTALGSAQLLHHGYTPELVHDRNKVERNLKLLQLALAENPADVNLVMNLGLELVRSGDINAGIVHYREAYEMMSAQPPKQVVPELREVLLTQFTSQLYKVRGHTEVVRVLNSPLAKNAGLTASLHFTLGLSCFELHDYQQAAENMRECLAKRGKACLSPINLDIRGAAPNHCLALCLSRLNDAAGAEKSFQAAGAADGDLEAVKFDHAKFLSDAKRPVEALRKLNEIVAVNAKHAGAWKAGGEIALSSSEFAGFACDWTGEALRALPEDAALMAQRAEALMLHGEPAAAAKLWQRLEAAQPDPRQQAALILCELAGDTPVHKLEGGADELSVTRCFIEWYQRLISVRAHTVVEGVNARLEKLSHVLPTAAQMIESALAETGSCVPA